MAAQNNNRLGFYEMVLAGPLVLVHGLLAGLKMGSGETGGIFYSSEEKITGPKIADKVKEFIHFQPRECHVVVDSKIRALIKKRAKDMLAECDVELVSERRVRSASFKFSYQAFAPRYGREIQKVMHSLPDGLKLVDHVFDHTLDPDAKGMEGYTPAHDYEVNGSGKVIGRIDLVIEARKALDDHPLIQPASIELDLA